MIYLELSNAEYKMLVGKRGALLRHAFHRMQQSEPGLRFEQLLFSITEAMEGRRLPAAYDITLPTPIRLDYTPASRGRSVPVVWG